MRIADSRVAGIVDSRWEGTWVYVFIAECQSWLGQAGLVATIDRALVLTALVFSVLGD